MIIRRFVGATTKEATEQMKKELGPDAIVLNTRTVPKGGVMNFLGKEQYEITGAIDDVPETTDSSYTPQRTGDLFARYLQGASPEPASLAAQTKKETSVESLSKVAGHFERRLKQKEPGRTISAGLTETATIHSLKSEVESLKAILGEVADHVKYSRMPYLPEHLKTAYATLVENGVDDGIAAELTQAVYAKLGEDHLFNKSKVTATVVNEIAQRIRVAEPIESNRGKVQTIALIGPTGVGKTTTIAKLAAICKIVHKMDVALVSADTYRIGAIEQLKTFAAIADMPMEVAYKPAELSSAVRKFRDRDVVFIDTVGRSQRMKKDISELAKFMNAVSPDETHLVMSVSTNTHSLYDILEGFKPANPNKIIFSKIDEAASFGSLVNIAFKSKLPISYLTVGQRVPDDIEFASASQIAGLVYAGEKSNA